MRASSDSTISVEKHSAEEKCATRKFTTTLAGGVRRLIRAIKNFIFPREMSFSGKKAGSVHRMSAHMQAGRRSATASLRYTCANTTIKIPENISRSYANSRLIISVNRSLSSCSVIQEPFPHTPELLREIFRLLCLSSSLKQSGFDDRTKTVKSENEQNLFR